MTALPIGPMSVSHEAPDKIRQRVRYDEELPLDTCLGPYCWVTAEGAAPLLTRPASLRCGDSAGKYVPVLPSAIPFLVPTIPLTTVPY